MIPLIYSCGPKAMDTVPDTGQGRWPLFFSKLPERCMSSSLENTVFEADLIGLNEAAVLSAGSAGREGLEAAFSVAAAVFLFLASLIARSRARLMAAAMAPASFWSC